MPSGDPKSVGPLVLVCGEDEFTVKQRARRLYQQWCQEAGGMDHEVLDASVTNSGEALRALARLREALQTLPFFGRAKVVWLQNVNFLGDERTAESQAVTANLAELADELKAFRWDNVRLLVSAGKVDKRKLLYKTIEKIGRVEIHVGLSAEDRDWPAQAERWVRDEAKVAGKRLTDEALAALVEAVGPNLRSLSSELEKVVLFAHPRDVIEAGDIEAVVTHRKQARAFALGDALGDRQVPRLLRALEDELWEIKLDNRKSAIGVLYGVIAKVRVLIFLKEMSRSGWLKPESDFSRFKAQLTRVPGEALPADKRLNPLAMNPYVLFKALPQTRNYTLEELIQAMERLLDCNQRLIYSSLDEALVLQQTLLSIAGRRAPAAAESPAVAPRPRPVPAPSHAVP
ncbi:MAG: DNA polymerase III subunit delta [Verrucomicrobia bacterium]|nr:DNA polymerase III subunit delta [Verrucomicrobiota bacterium]